MTVDELPDQLPAGALRFPATIRARIGQDVGPSGLPTESFALYTTRVGLRALDVSESERDSRVVSAGRWAVALRRDPRYTLDNRAEIVVRGMLLRVQEIRTAEDARFYSLVCTQEGSA